MLDRENLPEKFLQFHSALTSEQRKFYEELVSDLESNAAFMQYVSHWNKEVQDAYLDNMYGTVNYKMCLLRDVRRLEWLDMFSGDKKQIILDIGCGTGYFSYFAAKRGHTVYSLDAPLPVGYEIFLEGQKALGLSMIYHTITPYRPLPELPQACTVAVSFSPHFYKPSTEDFWRKPEWSYFLKSLVDQMLPDGTIYFHLNMVHSRPEFGPFGTKETQDFFLSLGTLERKYIYRMEASAFQKRE